MFRLAMIAGVIFFGAAAMIPPPNCAAILRSVSTLGIRPIVLPPCESSWHIGLRLAIAATGIVIALVLAFLGARLDQMIVRKRRWRTATT
jgi:hypothetical protein